jgi:rSAM/selenodomain-associated transferase 1
MSDQKLIVFVKAPRSGAVKTRLAATIGAREACAAYQRLVETLLRHLADLENVELRFTPDDASSEVNHWARSLWRVAAQGSGDLGCRLDQAFRHAFNEGAKRAVIIGSDCPDVRGEDIQAAWTALLSHDVVLGAATDGGYWLIGLREPQPELFAGIPWSTGEVLRQTLDRCRITGLKTHLLRKLSDVDTEDDWQQFLTRMRE